jgi:hypothetical protein
MANPLNSGRTILCPVILILILVAGQTFCQTPLSNEQVLFGAAQRATTQLLDSLRLAPTVFSIAPATNLDAIMADGVKSAFLKAGWTLGTSGDSSSKSELITEIRLSAFHFRYKGGKSRGFLKRPFINRNLTGQIAINLSGHYSYIGFRDVSYDDQIPHGQANIVASPKYNQLAPELPRPGAGRFLEPIAVGVTVGGLIYLFFASR